MSAQELTLEELFNEAARTIHAHINSLPVTPEMIFHTGMFLGTVSKIIHPTPGQRIEMVDADHFAKKLNDIRVAARHIKDQTPDKVNEIALFTEVNHLANDIIYLVEDCETLLDLHD